jgi:hypothetical protein
MPTRAMPTRDVQTRSMATEAALRQRLDSLAPLVDEARVAAEAADVRRRQAERVHAGPATDTIQVGPLHVITLPAQVDDARAVFRDVWNEGYARFAATSPSLGTVPFVFQWSSGDERIEARGPVRRVELRRFRPRSAVEATVRTGIAYLLASDLQGTRVARWAPGNVQPPTDPAQVYRQLASAPSVTARACFDGDPEACWVALGADLQDDAYPLTRWYGPEERRALVGRMFSWRRDADDERRACLDQGPVDTCDAYLKALDISPDFLAPLTGPARKALLWIALQEGGAGAWDRLLARGDASPGDALRYASGMDERALAAAWRGWVLEHRPASQAGLDPLLLVAVLWIVAFGALAMRSTRWRFG